MFLIIKKIFIRAREAKSFLFYKICIFTGVNYTLCRSQFDVKSPIFKHWPQEFGVNDKTKSSFLFKDNSYSFHWLKYVALSHDRNIRKSIKAEIDNWIENFKKVDMVSWAPVIVSSRLYQWLYCYNNIIKTSEKDFRYRCLKSIYAQFKFLKNIRFLNYKITHAVSIYKALIACSIFFKENNETRRFLKEFIDIVVDKISNCDELKPVKILRLIRDLEDITAIIDLKSSEAALCSDVVDLLKKNISFVVNKNGLAVFGSKYTPSVHYIKSIMLPQRNSAEKWDRFEKIMAFESEMLIDKKSCFLNTEFSFPSQIANCSEVTKLRMLNPENELRSYKIFDCDLEQEHGFSLFEGNSRLDYVLGPVSFSKRIYMNNLGTEFRFEIIITSTFKMSVVIEFIFYELVAIDNLLYQNGVNITLSNGKKLLLNASTNIDISFFHADSTIINGNVVVPTVIRLDAFKDANFDCVCKWAFKESS